jgi:ribosomal protein S18 acetylase RimI-like enzyme
MRPVDWRGAPPDAIAPLYESEIDRWSRELSWDTRTTWEAVEAARRAAALPGFVLRAAGQPSWAFFLPHGAALQIGAFVASTTAATGELLDAILETTEARTAREVQLFTFPSAPGLDEALGRRGFEVERYVYLTRTIDAGLPDDGTLPRWPAPRYAAVATLLARAYGPPDATRPFAREGTSGGWVDYVGQLVATDACGVFLPEASLAVENGTGIGAVLIATRIAVGTAHIAQVAVDPALRARGTGRQLVETAISRLSAAAFTRVTLLVAERNSAARAIYERLGFVECARFVSAVRAAYPRRLSNPALDTGGVSIRR